MLFTSRPIKTITAVTLLAAVGFTSQAFAGEDDIKYRKATMKAVGVHMTAIATILKTGAGQPGDIALHANAMADLAKIAAHAFPENSSKMDGETEAKMAIWEKPEDFKKITMAFIAESEKLAQVASGGDMSAIGAQLGALGKNACKACHDDFREKK